MSQRTLAALSWTVPAVLAAVGAYFAAFYEPSSQPGARDRGESPALVNTGASVTDVVRSLRHVQAIGDQARHARGGEDAPKPDDLRRMKRVGANAEAIAREFFAAFARYELGGDGVVIRKTFRSTATRAFVSGLLARSPRIPPGAEQPARAELGQLDFVPAHSDPGRREVLSGELVGVVYRAGERSPIAIELVNDAGWRVAGISR